MSRERSRSRSRNAQGDADHQEMLNLLGFEAEALAIQTASSNEGEKGEWATEWPLISWGGVLPNLIPAKKC